MRHIRCLSAAYPLSGPRLEPVSGKARHLVVLAHGYGADGNDLIELARHWQRLLPDAAFIAPNGPERCAEGPGYQWFPLSRLDPHELAHGVASAAPILNGFLESELAHHGLSADRLALVGFSQGTMLSLAVGLSRGAKPAAIVGYSGVLAAPPPHDPGAGCPPVLLVHGERDDLVPAEALFMTAGTLGAAGVSVQWHVSAGLGHGIDEAGLVLGGNFLALALSGRLGRGETPISCSLAPR